MAEEIMEDEQKKFGMTKDGSLVVDEENDYAIQFLKNIDWNRPLKKTTSSIPFISKEEFSNTMAMKYMNYECEALYVDDTDPMIGENIKDLRANEDRPDRRGKKKTAIKDFQEQHQTVREIPDLNAEDNENEEDDFLDEYGNLKEPPSMFDQDQPDDDSSSQKETDVKIPKNKQARLSIKVMDPSPSSNNQKRSQQPHKPTMPSQEHRSPKKRKDRNQLWKDHDQVQDDAEVHDVFKKQNPFQKSNWTLEPRESFLNHQQQKDYLVLDGMVKNQKIDYSKQTDMEKYNTWNMYREEIQKEQKEYMLWAENQILNAKQSNQVELSPEARNFAEAHIQQKLQNIKKLPQHYFPVFRLPDSMLRLVAMSNEQQINPPQYEMRPESQLLELGKFSKIRHELVMRLITENPTCKIDENTLKDVGKEKLVKLSDDTNIEKLLLGNPSDLVISIGALKTIVANFAPHMAEEWILPMKTVKIQDKLVFIIDSPLIKAANFSIVEKAQMATRKTVKNTLAKPWLSSNSKTSKIPSKVDQKTFTPERKLFNMDEEDDLFDTTLDTSSLENFGNQVDGTDDMIVQLDGNDSEDSDEPRLEIVEEDRNADNITDVGHGRKLRTRVKSGESSGESGGKEKKFKCPNCNEGFRFKFYFTSHVKKCKKTPNNQGEVISSEIPKSNTIQSQEENSKSVTVEKPNDATNVTKSDTAKEVPANMPLKKRKVPAVFGDDKAKPEEEEEEEESNKNEQNDVMDSPEEKLVKLSVDADSAVAGNAVHHSENSADNNSKSQNENSKSQISSDRSKQNEKKKKDNFLGNIMESTSHMIKAKKTPVVNSNNARYKGDYVAVATSGDPLKDYEQLRTEKNVHYRSWILNPKGKSIKDGFRIIMRGATHGLQERNLETFTLSSKLETQMPYGLEQLNRKELALDWIATMARINPGMGGINSKLARARIDARTGQILHVDIKRLCDLTADGQKLDFNPAYALGNLYLLLSGLRQHIIEEGQYILKHDVSSGAFVKILKAGDNVEDNMMNSNQKSFDLHEFYEKVDPKVDAASVTHVKPLDMETTTPWHWKFKQVPGCFKPCEEVEDYVSFQRSKGSENQSGRRGKGRGGRRNRGGGGRRGRKK